jgi:hypothetical protein
MNTIGKVSRVLGWAFLFQAVTSLISGVLLETKWYVEGDISATLANIANHPGILRANILVDMLTAFGIIFLGAMLYIYLRKINEKMALVGFGFYILEAIVIASSRINAFPLIDISQEYVASGQTAAMQTLGTLAYNSSHFGGMALSMLAFCAGAIPLYYLLFKSKIIPQWLALIGLITTLPCLVGTILVLFGYNVPFAVFAPYVPFEFVTAIWILVRGVKESALIASPAYMPVSVKFPEAIR